MDPISHAIVGAAIAAVAPQATPAVMVATITGAVSPDCDFVVRYFKDHGFYLRHHRGVSHSPGALGVLALAIAGLTHLVVPGSPGFWALVGWTALGLLSHVLLDCTNNYGTMALWPWVRRRIHWDWTFIVDVQLLGIIAAAALANLYWPEGRRVLFAGALAVSVAYMLLRGWIHGRVVRAARALYPGAETVFAQPGMLGFNAWRYTVHAGNRWYAGPATAFPLVLGKAWRVDDQDDPAVVAARSAPMAQHFLSWAQLVRATCTPTAEGGYRVRFTDMRFDFPDFAIFSCTVVLDADRRILADELNGGGPPQGADRRTILREMFARPNR